MVPTKKNRPIFFEDLVAYAERWQEEEEEREDLERETFTLALQHAHDSRWIPLAERLQPEPQKSTDAVSWWIYLCTRGDPPRPILGEGNFASGEDLLSLPPEDPLLALENTLALARLYEEAQNYPEALKGLYELKALAQRLGNEGHLRFCLEVLESFCWNHHLNDEGLRVCEELAAYWREKDSKEYGFVLMQKAAYLGRKEGFEAGLHFLRSLEKEIPDHDWLPLNLARYLQDHGRRAEAVEAYRALMQRREELDPEVVSCACAELEELLEG